MTDTVTADRALASIHRALLKYGAEAVLRSPGVKSGPAHNPTFGDPVDTPCRVLRADWNFKEVQDSRILATDTKYAMEADGITLTPAQVMAHKLVAGDPAVAYTIVKAQPRELQGKKVIWWLQARA